MRDVPIRPGFLVELKRWRETDMQLGQNGLIIYYSIIKFFYQIKMRVAVESTDKTPCLVPENFLHSVFYGNKH